jgi:hypothetical protein
MLNIYLTIKLDMKERYTSFKPDKSDNLYEDVNGHIVKSSANYEKWYKMIFKKEAWFHIFIT